MTDRKHFIGSSSYKRKEGISPGTSLYSSCHPQPKGNRYWRGALRHSGSAVGKLVTFVWHRFRLVSWPEIFISYLPLLSNPPPPASFVLTQPPFVSVLLQCVKELWIWRSLSELCQMLAGWRWMWLLKAEGQMALPLKMLGALLRTLPVLLGCLLSCMSDLKGKRTVFLHVVWALSNVD